MLMLFTCWKKIEDRVSSIFHRRSLRTYLRVLVKQYFLLTWVCLAVWYVAVVQGCRRYPPNPYLEAFCFQPHSSLGNGTPWELDPWNASNEHSTITFSHETILTSHLGMDLVPTILQQQASRLKDTAPKIISTDNLSSSIGMLRVSMISIQLPYTPAYYFHTRSGHRYGLRPKYSI